MGLREEALQTIRGVDDLAIRLEREVDLLLLLGRKDEASRVVDAARVAQPQSPVVLETEARLRAALGQLAAADSLLKTLGTPQALNGIAWHHAVADDVTAESLAAAREAARAQPRDRAVLGTLVLTEALAGNVPEYVAARGRYDASAAVPGLTSQEEDVAAAVIAAQVGFTDEAKRRFKAVRPLGPAGTSTDELLPLVKKRLAALNGSKQR